MIRLTEGRTRLAVWACIWTINIIYLMVVLILWVQCRPTAKIWHPEMPGTCWDPKGVGIFDAIATGVCLSGKYRNPNLTKFQVYSGLMDLALTLVPWLIIPRLNLSTGEKWGIMIAMSMGIL
jgi:hypothetical protein